MEPSVDKYHLVEYPRQLQCNFIPINIVLCQIRQVIHTTSLDVLHYKDAFRSCYHLGDIQRRPDTFEVSFSSFSVLGFVYKVHLLWQVLAHLFT